MSYDIIISFYNSQEKCRVNCATCLLEGLVQIARVIGPYVSTVQNGLEQEGTALEFASPRICNKRSLAEA